MASAAETVREPAVLDGGPAAPASSGDGQRLDASRRGTSRADAATVLSSCTLIVLALARR